MQVHLADRGIFVSDDNFIGRPCKEAAVHRITIVVGSYTDPIAALEADVLRLGPPLVRLIRLADLRGIDRLVRRHFGEFAVPNGRNSLVPGVDDLCESDQIVHLAATVPPCEPDRVVGRQIGCARIVPEYELATIGQDRLATRDAR